MPLTRVRRRKLNKLASYLTLICILSASFHLYPVYERYKQLKPQTQSQNIKGIIIQENTPMYSLPSTIGTNNPKKIDIGEEVAITNKTEGWYKIKTSYGSYWVESKSLLLEKI